MKYIKLFFISVFVFGLMLFCISLLFPTNTIVSRAVNVKGAKNSFQKRLPQIYEIAFLDTANFKKVQYQIDSFKKSVDSVNGEFISSTDKETYSDTLIMVSPFASHIQQGAAVYQTASDSTVIQVFYKIHVPTYKFWDKFGLMLNENKYGPSLDSAVSRIKDNF